MDSGKKDIDELNQLHEAVERLQSENKYLLSMLNEGRELMSSVINDSHKHSYLGGIKALVRRIEELESMVKQFETDREKFKCHL